MSDLQDLQEVMELARSNTFQSAGEGGTASFSDIPQVDRYAQILDRILNDDERILLARLTHYW